jgi:hypothetical protein
MYYFCKQLKGANMKVFISLLMTLLVLTQACVSTQKPSNTQNQTKVDQGPTEKLEDYAHLWIPEPETAKEQAANTDDLSVNKEVLARIDAQAKQNSSVKYLNGYRIQLYVGRDKALATEAKLYVYQHVPNTNPYLTYNLPMYKVLMGDYPTKASAEAALAQVKNSFPSAILVSEKIDISKHFNKN